MKKCVTNRYICKKDHPGNIRSNIIIARKMNEDNKNKKMTKYEKKFSVYYMKSYTMHIINETFGMISILYVHVKKYLAIYVFMF